MLSGERGGSGIAKGSMTVWLAYERDCTCRGGTWDGTWLTGGAYDPDLDRPCVGCVRGSALCIFGAALECVPLWGLYSVVMGMSGRPSLYRSTMRGGRE